MSVQQNHAFVDEGGGSGTASTATSPLAATAQQMAEKLFDRRFHLTDSLTGVPLARQPYQLTAGTETLDGITDDDGYTEPLPTGTTPTDVVCAILGVEEDDCG